MSAGIFQSVKQHNIRLSGIDAKLLQINDLILVKVYRIYTDIYDERI
jgi:hypothetical protein